MLITRLPRPELHSIVQTLWATDERAAPRPPVSDRERVLPTGSMHVAIRLSSPLCVLGDPCDAAAGRGIDHAPNNLARREIGYAVIGGARPVPYVRDISEPAQSVGAQLRPGAGEALFGAPAEELAGRHTPLDDLWGGAVAEVRERLLWAESAEQKLDIFESYLAARLRHSAVLHPVVAYAIRQLATTSDIGEVVRQTGCSHRRFIALFRRSVGLTPKLYCRVLRFQRSLKRLAREPAVPLVEVALDAGYSDQPHFNRDFREFAGLEPGAYRRILPSSPNHLPLPGSAHRPPVA